jgi:phage portal protein BeeE
MGLTSRIADLVLGQRSVVVPAPLPYFDNLWPYANLSNGNLFPLNMTMQTATSEELGSDFGSLAAGAYKANGIVFACMLARLMIFSEARFQFQQINKGRPGNLYGTADLDILEHPWPGATTGDLLTQMLADADLAGNCFLTKRGGQVRRLRPDWTSIIIGSDTDPEIDSWDLDAEILGYVYYPGGKYAGRKPTVLLREQVAHFKPVPDPTARFRGMSWLTPIVREIQADSAATNHKLKFFENGATPNLVYKRTDSPGPEVFAEWVRLMESNHAGAANAYKSLYLTAGADATVVGTDLRQLEFKVTQGAGETRIAAAAGIHPVIVGLSEGLAGSSLNAGNFNSARRLVADRTMSPLWRNAAGSMETLVPPRTPDRLWIDTRDIPFLREDRKDAADIQLIKAQTIRQLVDSGFEADSVTSAVEAEDMSLLVHSGLFSGQLQAPGSSKMPEGEVPGMSPVGGGTAPLEITPAAAPPNGKVPAAPGVKT